MDGLLELAHGQGHRGQLGVGLGQLGEAFPRLQVVLGVHPLGAQPQPVGVIRDFHGEHAFGEGPHGLDELLARHGQDLLALAIHGDGGLEGQLHVRGLEHQLLAAQVHQHVLEDGQGHAAVEGVLQDAQGAVQPFLGNLELKIHIIPLIDASEGPS